MKKKVLIILLSFILILTIFLTSCSLILSDCRFLQPGAILSSKEKEPYKVVFKYQVPFTDYIKIDTYIKLQEDEFGRTLIYLETREMPIYLVCVPKEDSVSLYDDICYMYSEEKIDIESEKMQGFLKNNDWNKEFDVDKMITYPFETIKEGESADYLREERLKKSQELAGVNFDIESAIVDELATSNGKQFKIVKQNTSFEKEPVEKQAYVYSIDKYGEVVYAKALFGDCVEWQSQLAEYKKIIANDENILNTYW